MSYLRELVRAQKKGNAIGIPSVCTANTWVLETCIQRAKMYERPVLIESTCNQVNQFGGYTGMKPVDFVGLIYDLADQFGVSYQNIILGGDHLGPNPWKDETVDVAMDKAKALVKAYIEAGYKKIHLDASMRLGGDDLTRRLDVELIAKRAAELARVAEDTVQSLGDAQLPFYVIGTEVPIPGGAVANESDISVTTVDDVKRTIEVTHLAFVNAGLEDAWERVIAVVVQPGVEFGDANIHHYDRRQTLNLKHFIEEYPQLVFEAHSTDYQLPQSLRQMVEDHFAILKVGPALTFAFREAVFSLAMMENELFPSEKRSNIINVLDDVMKEEPRYWWNYYHGTQREQLFKRRYSFSDRIRYYWAYPQVQNALGKLLRNLKGISLPISLLSQFAPVQCQKIRNGEIENTPKDLIYDRINAVLDDYDYACFQG